MTDAMFALPNQRHSAIEVQCVNETMDEPAGIRC